MSKCLKEHVKMQETFAFLMVPLQSVSLTFEGKVTVTPGSLKSCTDLLAQLTHFSLPLDGTVPFL